jgi:chromosome segregation ATPase
MLKCTEMEYPVFLDIADKVESLNAKLEEEDISPEDANITTECIGYLVSGDIAVYIATLEWQLEKKRKELKESRRQSELTAGIVAELHPKLEKAQADLEEYREDYVTLENAYKKFIDNSQSMENLVTNLEAENVRQTKWAERAEADAKFYRQKVEQLEEDALDSTLLSVKALQQKVAALEKENLALRAGRMPSFSPITAPH